MGYWKKGFEKSKSKGEETLAEVQQTEAHEECPCEAAIANVTDWEERHFQICLALISRADIGLHGTTNSPSMPKIIKKADEMVALLKEHYSQTPNQD